MEKVYKTKEGKMIWVILIFLTIINLFMLNERIMFLPYIALVIFVCALFLSYEFKIKGTTLTYRVILFGLVIVKKEAAANEVKEIYFINLRGIPNVLIKPTKGMRWKLARFKPDTYADDVYQFAEQHGIKKIELNGYQPTFKNEQ
ncbi:hypothetical protein [Alkalihalobacterium elongatum]|uniref:hypothetical protein n=1 Tax=Alkalihalobacterium elongatum TaxID=2675466 RepID=UPI001C200D54|nr:hypothetical protein [Alkalihalobacterium elongatum]